jgi:hypothetical protein
MYWKRVYVPQKVERAGPTIHIRLCVSQLTEAGGMLWSATLLVLYVSYCCP